MTVESIIGFLQWITSGFPAGKPHIGYLRHSLAATKRKVDGSAIVILDARSREALAFWARFFRTWDGRCPVFLDFGPMATAEVLWRYDASTEWGMGAFSWHVGSDVAYYILHEWTTDERRLAFVDTRESTTILEAMASIRCVSLLPTRADYPTDI